MIGTLHGLLRTVVALALAGGLLLTFHAFTRARPQDLPWTELDLTQPIGLFTGRKLAALTEDAARCRSVLDRAGVAYAAQASRRTAQCGYDDAVRLRPSQDQIAYRPADVAPSCPVAAALKLWEWHVVQPTAEALFGQPVRRIDHFGSYSCRRLYGRGEGPMSEHATADALDIAGFVLMDGTRLTVARDWQEESTRGLFLRQVRDGACTLFSTVLSPDYNVAHADHLHLDQAERGALGGRLCR